MYFTIFCIHFTVYLPENSENVTEDDKKLLSISFE